MTLLPNAAVTILIDGLIYTAYNEQKRLFQAGVHTEAKGHHVVVEVKADGKLLFPTEELPWNSSHVTVKENAPYWLYVDSGSGVPSDFSASLHNTDLSDPQSFGHTFSFERQYHRDLDLQLSRLAEFNFPHGTCYTVEQTRAKMSLFVTDPHMPFKQLPITVSAMSGIDIASTSEPVKRWIVLASKKKEEFRFPLDPGRHYQITLLNTPIDPDEGSDPSKHHPENHFLQFYDLFKFNEWGVKYLVEADEISGTRLSPPCLVPTGSQVRGLGN